MLSNLSGCKKNTCNWPECISNCCIHLIFSYDNYSSQNRVRIGPEKPEKSWNFILAFLESSGNLLNSTKKYKVYGRQ